MTNKNLLLTALLIAIFFGTGFYGGMKYQLRSKFDRNQFQGGMMRGNQFGNQPGSQNNFRGRMGGQTIGEILNIDDKSMTVKMIDGSSKIILFSTNTSINKSAEGSLSDLIVGQKVAVFGSSNNDGSLTAQSIQLNPILRGGQLTPTITK